MASALKLPIFEDSNVSVIFLTLLTSISGCSIVETLGEFNQHKLIRILVIKLCLLPYTSNFNIYLWNRVFLFGQPLYSDHARLWTPCTNATTL